MNINDFFLSVMFFYFFSFCFNILLYVHIETYLYLYVYIKRARFFVHFIYLFGFSADPKKILRILIASFTLSFGCCCQYSDAISHFFPLKRENAYLCIHSQRKKNYDFITHRIKLYLLNKLFSIIKKHFFSSLAVFLFMCSHKN